jgi:hypothetical protein
MTGFETVSHHRPKDGLALEAHLRACEPVSPFSNMAVSTSITFRPNVIEAALKVTQPPPRADTVENIIHTGTR